MTAAPAPPLSARTRPATPAQLDWLAAELPLWRSAGLVDDRAANAILASYHPTRRFELSSLLLTLGAAFVGVGIIWLVASNLDQLPPLTRFLVVAAFWLAFLVGGELLAGRREHGGAIPSPVVGAVRILAALTFGAVVIQAAQSLQVPAYEPAAAGLVGPRRPGPRVRRPRHRPARRRPGRRRLLAGLADHVGVAGRADRAARPLRRGCGGRVRSPRSTRPGLAPRSRASPRPGARSAPCSPSARLFTAALPYVTTDDFTGSTMLVVVLVAAGLVVVAAAALATDNARLEPADGTGHRRGRRAPGAVGGRVRLRRGRPGRRGGLGARRPRGRSPTSARPPGSPSWACCATASG